MVELWSAKFPLKFFCPAKQARADSAELDGPAVLRKCLWVEWFKMENILELRKKSIFWTGPPRISQSAWPLRAVLHRAFASSALHSIEKEFAWDHFQRNSTFVSDVLSFVSTFFTVLFSIPGLNHDIFALLLTGGLLHRHLPLRRPHYTVGTRGHPGRGSGRH